MLRRRVIPCLDVANGRVVKGTRFLDLVDEGDPPELAERYAREGADELVFLDITAAPEGRATLLDIVERTARRAFIPLTVGGGVRTVADMRDVLRAGADKVSLNTARQKTKNLSANPAVTVFIHDPANPARYLEIRGDATLEPDDEYVFANRVGAKYGGVDIRTMDGPGQHRVVVTVNPARINAVDLSAG
jgi:hypothetical protein